MALVLLLVSQALLLVVGLALILVGVYLALQRRRNRRAAVAAQAAAPGGPLAAALAVRRDGLPRVVTEAVRGAASLPARPWVDLDLARRGSGSGITVIIPRSQWTVSPRGVTDSPPVEAAVRDLRCLLRACMADHEGRGGNPGFLVQTGVLSRFAFAGVNLVEVDRRWVASRRLPVVQLPWDPTPEDGWAADEQTEGTFGLFTNRCAVIPWLERQTGFGRMVGFRVAGWDRGLLFAQGELLESRRGPRVSAVGRDFSWMCADVGLGYRPFLSPSLATRLAHEVLHPALRTGNPPAAFEVVAASGVATLDGDAAAAGLSRGRFPPLPWARDVLVIDARAAGRLVGRMVAAADGSAWKVLALRTNPEHWAAAIVVEELIDEFAFRVAASRDPIEVPRDLARLPVWRERGFRPGSRFSGRDAPTVELRRS